MTGGPFILDPAYVDEDLQILVNVEDDGNPIAGWALGFRLWKSDGTEVLTGLSVSVTDADAREVTAAVTGLSLNPGRYSWTVRRTDVGSRTLVAWGSINIFDDH